MDISQLTVLTVLLGAALALLLPLISARHASARIAMLAPLFGATLYYAIWRLSSLPDVSPYPGSIWPWAFFLVEAPVLTYEMWTYIVMTRRSDNTPEAEGHEKRLRASPERPFVDVLIATYNENPEILRQTILAALRLDYPRERLRIVVGDDGGRKDVRRLAAELGVDYLSRPPIEEAEEFPRRWRISQKKTKTKKVGGEGKGGNDRYSFAHTQGDYIILLDADFQIASSFIFRTLGFLLYSDGIGMVQTPQRFVNSDVVGYNLHTEHYVTEDQHFFMAITEPSRDGWGNAFCTGTGCIVSRSALRLLDPVWGFPHSTICEDLELTYALKAIGLRTLYLNERLATGLAPESIPGFLNQRIRWCAGTVQHLYAPTGPLRGHLPLLDRVFYCEGIFHWFGSVFTVFLLAGPIMFWLTGVSAIQGSAETAAVAVVPRLVLREFVLFWLSDRKIPPVVVNVSRVLPAFHVSFAFVKALLWPNSFSFSVTDKDPDRKRTIIRWTPFLTFACIGGYTLFQMLTVLLGRAEFAADTHSVQLNVLWTSFNASICFLCSLACIDRRLSGASHYTEVVQSDPSKIALALLRRVLTRSVPEEGGVSK